ncbi:hypothetical protein [Pseudoduganella lutea]|uniref:Peptidase M41 domain-containing protein n=1 Tax=Pseudoduganella lutea TaxID=321985 RepID=A0A4P6L450_9BURK|nr:hypothetical protein [Pseudoduganella lutea]QBE66351.1 hypothetical protein EWM63_28040 [Pseudoduganella lutea]
MELEPLEAIRWYVDQIARHELGHAVAARLLGFHSGKMVLAVSAANGDHEASTSVGLDMALSDVSQIRSYVEKRVIVLMAGTMAEPDTSQDLMAEFHAAFEAGPANSDRQKCEEFLQLLQNVEVGNLDAQPNHTDYYRKLVFATHRLITANHAAIDRIAIKMSHQVQTFGQIVKWPPVT